MNDGFVKLYGQALLGSSLMDEDVATRWVFVCLLAAADADGYVRAQTSGAVSRLAAVSVEEAERALDALSSPDPDSTSSDEDGRRILRADGGWRVVNYKKYRERRTPKQEQLSERQRRFRDRNAGYVYFAGVSGSNAVKIGFSFNPWSRVAEMRTANPGLELLGLMRGAMEDEKKLHAHFEHLRVPGSEWFTLDDELRGVVVTHHARSNAATPKGSASLSVSESVRGGVGGIRSNPLVGDRDARIRNCYAVIREHVAFREANGLPNPDPVEILGEASHYEGAKRQKLNLDSMTDDRLLATERDLKANLASDQALVERRQREAKLAERRRA